jgi:hypothetical protein
MSNRPIRLPPPPPPIFVKTQPNSGNAAVTTTTAAGGGNSKAAVSPKTKEESEQEKRKRLRMIQQAAFKTEASKRMSVLPSTGATSPKGPSLASVVTAAVAANNSVTSPTSTAPISSSSSAAPITPTSTSSTSPVPANRQQSIVSKISNSTSPQVTINTGKGDFERDNIARQQRLSKYGTMTVVNPTPGFVIKTKRNTGTKVFINLCSHASVPFKPEPVEGAGPAGANEVDANKVLYMIIGTPFEYQNEKDKSYCIIYDVLVHPDEIFVCTINASGLARHRLCVQVSAVVVPLSLALSLSLSLSRSVSLLRLWNLFLQLIMKILILLMLFYD